MVFEKVGQLSNCCRLARAVHADDQGNSRRLGDDHRAVHRREDVQNLLLDQIAQTRAVARFGLDSSDDPIGGGDADVGRDQQLFERLNGLDIDRTRSAFRLVGALRDLVEPIDDLLRRTREPLTDTFKKTHGEIW